MTRSRKDDLTCRICEKPLRLGTDTTTDENGKSVHEECQVKRIIGTQRCKELTQPNLRAVAAADWDFECNGDFSPTTVLALWLWAISESDAPD